jgi:hypothetical protein
VHGAAERAAAHHAGAQHACARADHPLAAGPADAAHLRDQFVDTFDNARMFFWLKGEIDNFHLMGGQGWPIPGKFLEDQYGYTGGIGSLRD